MLKAGEGEFPSLSRCFSLCPPLLSQQASFPLSEPASGCLTFLFDLELVSASASVIYSCHLFKQFLHLNTANVHLFPSLVFGGVMIAVKSETNIPLSAFKEVFILTSDKSGTKTDTFPVKSCPQVLKFWNCEELVWDLDRHPHRVGLQLQFIHF